MTPLEWVLATYIGILFVGASVLVRGELTNAYKVREVKAFIQRWAPLWEERELMVVLRFNFGFGGKSNRRAR
jgi:hypothetical protein